MSLFNFFFFFCTLSVPYFPFTLPHIIPVPLPALTSHVLLVTPKNSSVSNMGSLVNVQGVRRRQLSPSMGPAGLADTGGFQLMGPRHQLPSFAGLVFLIAILGLQEQSLCLHCYVGASVLTPFFFL